MNSPEFKNIVCRICLDENVALDWNNTLIEHSDVTYKECYYKYTQLNQLEEDPLSSMLCENCSNGLEEMHSLILKALDSYNFLLEVNCMKIDTDDFINDEVNNENCTSADFETVLVEKPERESVIQQQIEHEPYVGSSIKYEDEHIYENTDEMQYQELIEIEADEEFYDSQSNEDTPKVYEIKQLKRISCKRKFTEEERNTKIALRSSFSRHKSARQSIEMESKYNDFVEICGKSDSEKANNHINTEELQYEDEEYDDDNGADVEIYKAKSEGLRTSKGSLKIDAEVNDEHSFNKSAQFKTRYKDELQKFKSEKTNGSKTKNGSQTKKYITKPKKKNHLNSQNTPCLCSYCSKILHNKYALQKHEKTHLANRERKAPCPICGVKFLEESYVKIHMQIHNQHRVKKHKCEFCDKAFYEKGSLNVHRRIHLGQMIPCTLCSKEFFRQVDLDIHMNSHSAAVINAETKKRSRYWVRCKYCNKDIMSTSFKYHTAVHLNEPQMKCSICNREFFRRDSCTDHLKTIHKISTEDYSNFIILYNKNRLSHLYLEQTTELKK